MEFHLENMILIITTNNTANAYFQMLGVCEVLHLEFMSTIKL